MARTTRTPARLAADLVGVVVLLAAIFPVYWMVSRSFLPRNEIRSPEQTWFPFGGDLDNYRRVLDGGGPQALRDAAAATFATAYIPFMAGFVMLMLAEQDGAKRVGLFVLLVVASDTGGYTAGVLAGRHALAPSVSPKKTWEGLAGSVVLASAVGAAGMLWAFEASPLIGVALGVAAVLTATLGDLAESLLKRDLALKDMGSLLPGHGGVLDRIDAMLLTAPLVHLMLLALVPTA